MSEPFTRHRILLAGFGDVGRAVYEDYRHRLDWPGWHDRLMVTDPQVPPPEGQGWDGEPVDLTCVMVDTPAHYLYGPGLFDYRQLEIALEQYLRLSTFVVIRSTVGPDFLSRPTYLDHRNRIGFNPEFYGRTKHSRRGVVELGFSVFTPNVPEWFVDRVAEGKIVIAEPAEVIMAKLAENAFLATKVTFFHELFVLCQGWGIDFESVREIVTRDPRITAHHSYCDDGPGWSSHCFDKDVPYYARLAGNGLVQAVLEVNQAMLTESRDRRERQEHSEYTTGNANADR